MAKTANATLAREPAPRAKARDTVAPADSGIGHNSRREPLREPLLPPGAMTFTHPVTGEVLTRMPQSAVESAYHIPREEIPDGFTYQWVRESVYNEPDQPNIVSRGRNGWRAVPADRHPDRVVALDGLRLYEAPTVFVEAARREERDRAQADGKPVRPSLQLPNGFDDSHRDLQRVSFARKGAAERTDASLKPTYRRDVDSID